MFIATLLATGLQAWSQGTFQNLDFESPILPLIRDQIGEVPISKAMPGWTGYRGGTQIGGVFYNTIGLGGAVISFHDSASLLPPIQENYSVGLQPSSGGPPTTVAIAQTGLIPLGSQSIVFLTRSAGGPQALFAGQLIPLVQIGTGPNYVMLGGDVSQFAGRSGELRFTGGGFLDDIRFSDQAIPEPSIAGLSALGAGLLCWFCRRGARLCGPRSG